MLLLATAAVRRRKVRVWRVLLSAALGCTTATVYAIAPEWAQILIRILLAPIMCAILMSAQGKTVMRKIGYFLGTTAVFVMLTFFTGGVVYGVSYATGIDIKSYALLGLIAMAVCALLICVRLIVRKRSLQGKTTCKSTISVGEVTVSVHALCDSGNLLIDEASGLPVVILSQEVEDKLDDFVLEGYISVSTVGGEDSLPLVGLDEVDVEGKKFRAMGALSRKNFDNFDIILQNSMF